MWFLTYRHSNREAKIWSKRGKISPRAGEPDCCKIHQTSDRGRARRTCCLRRSWGKDKRRGWERGTSYPVKLWKDLLAGLIRYFAWFLRFRVYWNRIWKKERQNCQSFELLTGVFRSPKITRFYCMLYNIVCSSVILKAKSIVKIGKNWMFLWIFSINLHWNATPNHKLELQPVKSQTFYPVYSV